MLLRRGNYQPDVARYRKWFPDHQLHFIMFERFIQNTETVLSEVLEFLDLSPVKDPGALEEKGNAGRIPLNIPLQLRLNQISKRLVPFRYEGHFPGSGTDHVKHLLFLIDRTVRRLLNVRWKSRPPMSEKARTWLEDYYRETISGLTDQINKDLKTYWPFLE